MAKKKIKIGRTDKADFPLLSLFDIAVKIDTGAYTSVIHCHNIRKAQKNNVRGIKFSLLDPKHEEYKEIELFAENYEKKEVKSSNGISENRYIIESEIVLFNKVYPLTLSLTDRTDMKYPILLGRQILAQNFLVDVTKTDLSFKKKYKQKK